MSLAAPDAPVRARAPELEAVLLQIITSTMRTLTRLGAVIEEPEGTYLAETDTLTMRKKAMIR
jgi:hypothetical protein